MKFSKTFKKNQKTSFRKKRMGTVKSKSSKSILKKYSTQRAIKKYLSRNELDYEKYGEMLNHFKLFFKAIIYIDNKDLNSEEREKYDIKKDMILDKLNNIELKDPVVNRIKVISPDIYELLNVTNDKTPYYELIDLYYKILNKLEKIIEKEENEKLRSEATIIQIEVLDNLVNNFIKSKNKKINTIDDDLLDMFRGMGIKTHIDELENMFGTMKVEH